jgi:phospholipid/cholesterol/gamma-HCH transport system substrate-binding protein
MYTDVAGLQEGTFVRIAGINVGTVSAIALPDSATKRVRVTFRIRADAQQLIRADSKGIIDTEGLLGARIVVITQGSPNAAIVPPGGEIIGQSPIQFRRFSENIDQALQSLDDVVLNGAAMLASLSSIMAKIDAGRGSIGAIVNQTTLHDSIVTAIGRVRDLVETTSAFVRQTERTTSQIAGGANVTLQHYAALADTFSSAGTELRRTARSVNELTRNLQEGKGTFGRLVADDSLYVALTGMFVTGDTLLNHATVAIGEISRASRSIARSAEQVRTTIDQMAGDIEQGRGTVGKLVTDDSLYVKLDRIMTNMEIASQKLAVNMEAVRTNWLFRGYFDEQGYWDNLGKRIELQEQREIRLGEWEQRLQRLQSQLEEQERRLERQQRELRPTTRDTTRTRSRRE